ncbi:MAG TPA: hypothetical protein DHN29_16490 [Cytophagales bacterium]|jgi:hypothetical protein|nr:hypothetical protein [Cytophagales bacterium]|tara:strand:- start:2108 stop:2386 length:279 start_codon:yes stop_codon:yes gene_type:complete
MSPDERKEFWEAIESGDNPLLSAMSSLVERWGMPAIVMSLGDIANVLSEDAIDADNLTPNQRGLIMSCCAQVSNLSDLMHAEMDFVMGEGSK